MASRHTYIRRVAFAETDMAGIVHFANFFRYMEEAEHAFFRSVGHRISEAQPDGSVIGWPRVSATCSYQAPALYEDELTVEAIVERIGPKSLTFRYEFFRDRTPLATGSMKIVCCRFRPGEPIEPIAIPRPFADVIDEEPAVGRADAGA